MAKDCRICGGPLSHIIEVDVGYHRDEGECARWLKGINNSLLTALEQIRALQPTEPIAYAWTDAAGRSYGRWEAAQIADAAIRGQAKEGNTNG